MANPTGTIDPATIPTTFGDTAASVRSATAKLPAEAPLEVWVYDPETRTASRAAFKSLRPVMRGKQSRLVLTVEKPK